MNKQIQTPTKKISNFKVYQDGKVIYDSTPTMTDVAREQLITGLTRVYGNVKLEARMAVFDSLHGTNYRRIRRNLIEEQKRKQFELSIGLTRTK